MSARDSRAPAPLKTEKRATGNLRGPLEVDDAEGRAEVPMRLRREVERAWLAHAPDFDVLGGGLADRHTRMRQVGQVQHGRRALVIDGIELESELLDLLRACAIRFLDWCGVVPLPLGARNLVAGRVLLALQVLELGNQPPSRGFERGDVFEHFVGFETTIAEACPNLFDVVANVGRVEHVPLVEFSSGYCRGRRIAVISAASEDTVH